MIDSVAFLLRPLNSIDLIPDSSFENFLPAQSFLNFLIVDSGTFILLEDEILSINEFNLLVLSDSESLGWAFLIQYLSAPIGYSSPSIPNPLRSAMTSEFDLADLSRTESGSLSLMIAAMG